MKHVRTARPCPPLAASLLALVLLGTDARAQFVDNTADIPSGSPSTCAACDPPGAP